MAGECAASAFDAFNLQTGTVTLQDMLDDRKAETRTTGGAATPGIGAIEAFSQPRQMFGRDANAGIRDREVASCRIPPPADSNGTPLGRVLGGVVDQVCEGRVDLFFLADQSHRRVHRDGDLSRMSRSGEDVLLELRQQRGDINRDAYDR